MRTGGRWIRFMLLVLLTATLSGCWDRREVNDIAIVSGMAFDKVGGKYRLSVQFPLAGQLGGAGGGGGGTSGAKSWYVDSGTGISLKEADAHLQRSLSRQLYYAHRRVMVVGESAAREGISSLLDITVRTAQNRMSALFVVAKGEGLEVLNTNALLEQQPAEIIREITVNSVKRPRTIKQMVNILLKEGMDACAPYFVSEHTVAGAEGQDKQRVTLEGLALFKGDKLAGYLQGDAAKGLVWAMNQARHPTVTVKAPDGTGNIGVSFPENHVYLVPVGSGKDIAMKVKVRAYSTLFENMSAYKSSADNMLELNKVVAAKLQSDIEKGIKAAQQLKSDVCGFGDTIYRKKSKEWRQIKGDWEQIYPAMKVTVEVDLEMEHSGTTVEPAAKSKELMR